MPDKQAYPLVALAAAALAACGAEGPPQCLGPSALPASMELGSGASIFEPLVDGGTIRAYQGLQGGFHVLLSVRATGVDPGGADEGASSCDDPRPGVHAPCVELSVTDLTVGGTPTLSAFAPLHLPLSCTPDETAYQPASPRLVVLDIDSLAQVDGHLFEIRGTLTDSSGLVLEQRLTVECRIQ
jgi:hypothetical protein